MTDFTILAKPRMSEAGFAAVLHAHHSPSAQEAAHCYAAAVAAGVDPTVLLAVFQHESSFGTRGLAVSNRSWGNLRHAGSFIAYPTWTAGAADAARLLAVYGRDEIRPGTKTDTTQTFPYVWAPAADHNAPDEYGDAITAAVAAWERQYPVVTASRPAGTAGRFDGAGIALYRVKGGVATSFATGTVHEWVGAARHYKPNATLRRVLSGPHRGSYVHITDGTFTPLGR